MKAPLQRRLKLGKRPARKGAIKFTVNKYMNLSALPTPPTEFGHDDLVRYWGMLGNDYAGDCVWAGAAHEMLLWTRESGQEIKFDTEAVMSDYSSVTGYNPDDPSTDNGTDMLQAAEYRRTIGIADAAGKRHKILAYLSLEPINPESLYAAMYVFGAVGLGLRFPDSAMEQFSNLEPWTVIPKAQVQGGHYVPLFSRRGDSIYCVTWGQLQPMSEEFITTYADEAIVYLTDEDLVDGKTLEGFDIDQLKADLACLKPKPFSPLALHP